MTDPARRASFDDLLAHRRWVRAVALRLATNAADADDLEQEAWLAALRSPPRDESPKAWLGTVLRNLVRTRFRRVSRRERHETAAGVVDIARRAPTPSAEDVAATAELQTRLARAVLDLDEPYRSTVLFRFFEDWDPHEIARRTNVPLETVRTRLKRGVAILRERMGPDVGPDDRAWCLLVLGTPTWPTWPATPLVPGADGTPFPSPATGTPTGVAAAAAGGLAMGLVKKIVVTACVLLLAFATWQAADVALGPETAAAPSEDAARVGTRDPAATPRAGRAHASADAESDTAARDAETRDVAVEVVLPDGRPAPNAIVEVLDEPADPASDYAAHEVLRTTPPRVLGTFRTDAAGIARVELRAGASLRVLVARLPGFAAAAARLPGTGTRLTDPVRIRLGEAFALSGRVIDAGGASIAGATVVAERGTWSPLGTVAARALAQRAVCDDAGAFAFDALAAGVVPLRAARPGGAFVCAATVRVPEVGRIDVVLAHDLALAGRVTDAATGRGLASVTVRAWTVFESVSFAQETTTGADGEWRMEHVPVSFVHVRASCAGYVESMAAGGARPVDLAADPTARCDLALHRGASLSGFVTSPDGPVAGATVTAAHVAGLDVLRSTTTTSADGRYAFPAVVSGETVVVVSADGWLQEGFPALWSEAVRRGAAPPASVVTVPGRGAATLDITVGRGLRVTGTVVDQGGAPAAEASVFLSYPGSCEMNGPWTYQRASADGEGSFRFAGVARAPGVTLQASGPGGRRGETKATLDAEAGAEGVVVRLADGRRVVGTVTAPRGLDVARASVQMIDWSGKAEDARSDPWENAASCDVAPDGSYVLQAPSFARPWIRAVIPGRASSPPVEVTIPDAASPARIDLALATDSGVAGVVVLPDGRGVASARVSVRAGRGSSASAASLPAVVRDVRTETDGDGRFRLDGLLPGPTWELTVAADGCAPATVTFALPLAEPLVIRTTRAARIHGTVRFADGRGVGGVRMQLVGRTGALPETVSGPGGEFAFEGVLDSAYQIVVMTGGPANVIPCVVPGAARPGGAITVVVEEAFAISGRVTDGAGAPPAACYVQIFRAGEGPLANRYAGGMMAGADGAFSFGGLASGTFTILASPVRDSKSRELAPAVVDGVAAGAADVSVRLAIGLVIEGRVLDAAGVPVTGLEVSLETPRADVDAPTGPVWSGIFRTKISDDGRFRIAGLPAGAFRPVLFEGTSSRRSALQVVSPATVRAGETGVRLVAGSDTTIRGTVKGEDGGAWYVEVLAAPEGDPSEVRTVRSATDGTFQFDGLDPSRRWRVRVEFPGLPVARADDVRPGTLDVRLVIRTGKRASGRLLDADGQPLAKAALRFRRDGAEHVPKTQTADDGTFEVGGLDEAGPWTAEARVPVADGPAAGAGGGAGAWFPCGTVVAGETGAELRVRR